MAHMNDLSTAMSEHVTNPHYGDGCYRRRIHLERQPGVLIGALEDDCHGFRVRITHDDKVVTGVEGDTLRIPLNTCPGAVEPLQQLIGIGLATPAPEIVAQVPPRQNCTHLYDLALLTMAHAGHQSRLRQYDITVSDMPREAGHSVAEIALNGEQLHRWELEWIHIAAPAELFGRPVLNGFAAWANNTFSGLQQEAAFALSKGVFVALARMYDLSQIAGEPALHDEARLGVCYSYSKGVVEDAVRLSDSVRDFSNTPEQLLKFL